MNHFKTTFLIAILACSAGFALDNEREFSVGDSPRLSLSNVSGDITINTGTSDSVLIQYQKGDNDITVTMEQDGDHIEVKVDYPKGNFRNNGDVSFTVTFPNSGRLDINSVSGSIKVDGVEGRHSLNSVSGNIHATALAGELNLSTVSGDVIMRALDPEELEAVSVSGDIDFEGHLSGKRYEFTATSGDVTLGLDADSSFSIEGTTISGRITSEFDGLSVKKEKYSGMQSLGGEVGGGNAEVVVTTINGKITIKNN